MFRVASAFFKFDFCQPLNKKALTGQVFFETAWLWVNPDGSAATGKETPEVVGGEFKDKVRMLTPATKTHDSKLVLISNEYFCRIS